MMPTEVSSILTSVKLTLTPIVWCSLSAYFLQSACFKFLSFVILKGIALLRLTSRGLGFEPGIGKAAPYYMIFLSSLIFIIYIVKFILSWIFYSTCYFSMKRSVKVNALPQLALAEGLVSSDSLAGGTE